MCLPNENKFGMRLLYELKERKIFERDREKEREFQSPLITSFLSYPINRQKRV